jgi:MoaE-MoaD fusion protein
MTIRVRLFALARDLARTDSVSLELHEEPTVQDALDRLFDRFPSLAVHNSKLATAVNLEYVRRDYRLTAGDELALIPPVSGG